MYYVYVIQNLDNPDDFYLGYSANLKDRLSAHNSDKNLSTRGKSWRVIYYEAYLNEAVAKKREQKLKQNRRMKQFLFQRVQSQLNQK